MKITDVLQAGKRCLSFEVFPPKTSAAFESTLAATEGVGALKPDFMSVTYGAGGGTSAFTLDITSNLEKKYGIPVLAHLTCVNSTRETVHRQMELMRERGIENVMALRGDLVEGAPPADQREYNYACQLIEELREFGGFCIGGACYPEGHPESASLQEDLRHLKEKVDAGCQFLTTQMFFDNDVFYNFLYKVRDMGITVPVIPGIMPMTNVKQVKRTLALAGGSLPREFRYIMDRFGDNPAAFAQAGIAYATQQIVDLYANGIQAIHVYSMNNPDVARRIQANVSELIK